MQRKTIDYGQRYQQAVIGMVRQVLAEVAEDGLPGAHHFFITFDTRMPGVEISPALHEHYPEQMTIVLQNQFWGLAVDEDGFCVTLRFGGVQEPLVVPWDSVVSFADPSAEFGLQFDVGASGETLVDSGEGGGETADPFASAASEPKDGASADEGEAEVGATAVLDFEKFRKR